MGRGLIPDRRPKLPLVRRPSGSAPYSVLSQVSPGYSDVRGRLPTCYSPVRRSSTPEGAFPLDLHVLSTPPAFVLSQDQTLREQLAKSPPRHKGGLPAGLNWSRKSSMLFSKVDPPTVPAEPGRRVVDEVSVRPEGRPDRTSTSPSRGQSYARGWPLAVEFSKTTRAERRDLKDYHRHAQWANRCSHRRSHPRGGRRTEQYALLVTDRSNDNRRPGGMQAELSRRDDQAVRAPAARAGRAAGRPGSPRRTGWRRCRRSGRSLALEAPPAASRWASELLLASSVPDQQGGVRGRSWPSSSTVGRDDSASSRRSGSSRDSSPPPEQRLGQLDRAPVLVLAVHEHGHLAGQRALRLAPLRVLGQRAPPAPRSAPARGT